MRANGKVEDRFTVCQLTPKEHMSLAMQNDKNNLRSSVSDCWGQKTMIKDLGPDILNHVPDLTNYDPWEDEDRPSCPVLDDELTAADAAKDYLIIS